MNTLSYPSTGYRRWLFLAFLAVLHLVFLQGPFSQLGRLLFLVHIGIGLLWQPFIQPKRRVGFLGTAVVVICSGLLAFSLSWGLLCLWTMVLAGVAGGKVFLFPDRWERLFHLLGLGYLATVTFTLLIPQFLVGKGIAGSDMISALIHAIPILFVAMALLPSSRKAIPTEQAEIVDYVYGVMVFLLQAVIGLGSISFALLFKVGYLESLILTLVLVAAILLALGLIWHPGSGFGGVGSAVAQHVISLGLPLEDWLQILGELSKQEEDAARFMQLACAELPARLPGVIGCNWVSPDRQFGFGETNGERTRLVYDRVIIELVSYSKPSPTLLWHYDLACRLLAEYYMGKWRATELKRLSYIEAIHETGARLTHDVKNLLQTLDTLCVAAEQEGATPTPRLIGLLRRQLPEVALRLRQTLVKLSRPEQSVLAEAVPALEWLAGMENRFAGSEIHFVAEGDMAAVTMADPSFFSSIAENLLQNTTDKRSDNPGMAVELYLTAQGDQPVLEVRDTGKAIPPDVASTLFWQRVVSENGLGVGVYQCARLAESAGYRLRLAENRDGCVSFRLEPIA